jgi:uncharacterized protein YndB with AHSA1/START domain
VIGEMLRFERTLPAPRPLVFAAVTEARMLRRWMCPEGFSVTTAESEPEPGGRLRVVMRDPEGKSYAAVGEFLEVRAPELVAFSWTWEPGHTMAGIATEVRIELDEREGGTRLVMTHSGLPDVTERDSHRAGWTGALAKLTDLMQAEAK